VVFSVSLAQPQQLKLSPSSKTHPNPNQTRQPLTPARWTSKPMPTNLVPPWLFAYELWKLVTNEVSYSKVCYSQIALQRQFCGAESLHKVSTMRESLKELWLWGWQVEVMYHFFCFVMGVRAYRGFETLSNYIVFQDYNFSMPIYYFGNTEIIDFKGLYSFDIVILTFLHHFFFLILCNDISFNRVLFVMSYSRQNKCKYKTESLLNHFPLRHWESLFSMLMAYYK
jgi:hypothetical protein